jgi:RNA polymerase sigma-70 factor, ECF subfamily
LRLYAPRLRFYVNRVLGDRRDRSEDLLQEIWLSVFRALARLNDPAAFRSWLFRIARDRVCREFRRQQISFVPATEPPTAVEANAGEMNGALDVEVLRLHLDSLSAEHREALVLRFIEEMSYEEIARVTNSAPGTVRSRIHYAKRALRRAFEETNHELKRTESNG